MNVSGAGIAGVVSAFVRQAPVEQPSLSMLQDRVRPGEFKGITALVVGGSRGLGALTAKLLAAGGANVIVTYRRGAIEAQAVVTEIGEEQAQLLALDVLDNPATQLKGLNCKLDQMYYFATPVIARGKGAFSPKLFVEFCSYYIEGFENTVIAALAHAKVDLHAFYASTTYIEERPKGMLEYAMAKAAGELLCADLPKQQRHLRTVSRRLPRLLTDQTATVIPSKIGDSVFELLLAIRAMSV